MDKKIDFKKYTEFVDAVTSDASTDFLALSDRLVELDEKGANIERLLTGFIGMSAESAEGLDLVKKLVFQNKEWNPEIREHLIKECGDVCFYLASDVRVTPWGRVAIDSQVKQTTVEATFQTEITDAN